MIHRYPVCISANVRLYQVKRYLYRYNCTRCWFFLLIHMHTELCNSDLLTFVLLCIHCTMYSYYNCTMIDLLYWGYCGQQYPGIHIKITGKVKKSSFSLRYFSAQTFLYDPDLWCISKECFRYLT